MAKKQKGKPPPPSPAVRTAPAKTPPSKGSGLDVAALTLSQAAKILTKAGGQTVTEKLLAEDVAAGAPVNGDGTLHLVRYAAWLAAQVP